MNTIRTSLEIGFPNGELPPRFATLRGRVFRAAAKPDALPFEDSQFEVVLMDASTVSRPAVREAHRVLRPDGRLYFTVPEKTGSQSGFTLPEIYSIVRDGFHIVEVDRPPWWQFWNRSPTLTVCAQKKNWKTLTNVYRPYV